MKSTFKRLLPWLIAMLFLGGICWKFPPFHIRSAREVRARLASSEFNPTNFANAFWDEQLVNAADKAVDATKLLDAIAANPDNAQKDYGRFFGETSVYYFFLRGTGRVVSVAGDSVGLSLKPEGNDVDVSISLDFVFGNAVRDGTGLLNVSDYPDVGQLNGISACLNQIVENRVLPELRRIVVVGKRVRFVGCAEVARAKDLKPLKLVPIIVQLD